MRCSYTYKTMAEDSIRLPLSLEVALASPVCENGQSASEGTSLLLAPRDRGLK